MTEDKFYNWSLFCSEEEAPQRVSFSQFLQTPIREDTREKSGLKTQQPKSRDMVDRGAMFWETNGDRHHGLETDLRNKSGKVLITRNMRVRYQSRQSSRYVVQVVRTFDDAEFDTCRINKDNSFLFHILDSF